MIWQGSQTKLNTLPRQQRKVSEIIINGGDIIRNGLQWYAYPDFGLYLFRSCRLYLLVRCGSVGLNGLGAHAHNDQLAIELNVDGEDWITDPGTYLYTPLPDVRNRYRSVAAHYAPQIGDLEPGRLDLHMFSLGGAPEGHCLYFGKNGFLGVHHGFGIALYRKLEIADDRLIITDWADPGQVFDPCYSLLERNTIQPCKIFFSPGYGIRLL